MEQDTGYAPGIVIFFCLFTLLATACSDSARETSARRQTHNLSLPLPLNLAADHPLTAMVSGHLRVDNGPDIALRLDWKTRVATAHVPLQAGSHRFQLKFFAQTDAGTPILAQADIQQEIHDPETIYLAINRWQFLDEDGDLYTNLAEWQLGTDWRDASQRPSPGGFRASSNYLVQDQAGLDPVNGYAAGGDSRTYHLQALETGQ